MLPALKILCVLFCVAALPVNARAQCRGAAGGEKPHGANEFILITEPLVGRVRGRIFLPDYERKDGRRPAGDIVVELYRHRGGESYAEIMRTLRRPRLWACVTRADGEFALSGLKPGRYLLRVGTLRPDQFNETHVIFTHDPRVGAGKGLDIVLQLGT